MALSIIKKNAICDRVRYKEKTPERVRSFLLTYFSLCVLYSEAGSPYHFSNRLTESVLPYYFLLITHYSLLYYLSTLTTPPNAFIFRDHKLPILNCWNSFIEPGE